MSGSLITTNQTLFAMFHSLRAACVAAVLLCSLPAGMWGQRVCLSGCDGGGKVVQRFDPVAAQHMFDEAFFTIDSLTVAADSLEVIVDSLNAHVDSLEIDRDSLYIRLSRSVVLIDTLLVHVDSLWVLVDTLNAEIDSLQIQLAAVASSGGSGGSSSGGGCGSTPSGFACGQTLNHYGEAYSTVAIGSQCWFAENLKATSFCDGTPIPDGLTAGATASTAARGFLLPDSASTYAAKGLFYNWFAATDPRGLCPSGWHVPTDTEWQTMVDHLGGWSVAGGELKSPSPVWNGNSPGSGFNALQTGHWMWNGSGSFESVAFYAWWWTSTALDATNGAPRYVQTSFAEILQGVPRQKGSGMAVRCLQD